MEKQQTKKLEQISGTIEHFVYRNDENEFAIFHIKQSARKKITVTGIVPGLCVGEFANFSGIWEHHSKFGLQFKVETFERQLPTDEVGIEKYLSSGLISGIGPEMGKRLVGKFGYRTLEVIDKQPHRLLEVSGIGPHRAEKIGQAWQSQKEISRVMVFLRSKDIPVSLAGKIFKQYGQEAIEKITQNPYRLSEDLWGVGFKTADLLALKLGLDKLAPHRLRAAALHALKAAMNKGHLYLAKSETQNLTQELLQIEEENRSLIENTIDDLILDDKLKAVEHNKQTFLALPQCFWTEKNIATKIKTLQKYPPKKQFDLDAAYASLRNKSNKHTVRLSETQQRGIMTILQSKTTIITGGPGTGKTTLVKSLLDILESEKITTRLAAPTGRAAKRILEGTGKHAETIHRLLEFSPQSMRFERNEKNTLELDVLVVDETSMIDVFLANSLLKALPLHARLVLIGDIDQLPSVGPGNVLKDLINSKTIETVRLLEIFRQAQGSLIVQNAHKINRGEFPHSTNSATTDFIFISQSDTEKIPGILKAIHDRLLPKKKIKTENSILLTPMHRGNAGAQHLNHVLQNLLNPLEEGSKQTLQRMGQEYRVGDRVMQIRNNYDKFVFNGDMGIIKEIKGEASEMHVQFGIKLHVYESAELDELVLSYATSIHKSQGSEFDAVIIPIFCQHYVMLQRNLLYTAVTRAKKLCVLIGEPRAIAMAVKNDKQQHRQTFLIEALTEDFFLSPNL